MSLDTSRYRLWNAYQTLQAAWDDTQRHWHDQVRVEFDRKHMANAGPRLFAALAAIDQLAQILLKARQDCGEREEEG